MAPPNVVADWVIAPELGPCALENTTPPGEEMIDVTPSLLSNRCATRLVASTKPPTAHLACRVATAPDTAGFADSGVSTHTDSPCQTASNPTVAAGAGLA